MLFVIDTNIFVSSLSSKSQYHWVIDKLMDEEYELAVNSEILLEYEEILKQKYSLTVANAFLQSLQELPNVHFITTYFQWNLLNDPDDNKFVDVAVAANARYLVSEDNDFNVLKSVDFPRVEVLRINDFKLILEE